MTQESKKNTPRLYVPFDQGGDIVLSEGQQHYLRNVMRLQAGDRLRLFNGQDGEYLAEIKEISKKNVLISIIDKTHEQKLSPDVTVVASLVKKEALDLMIEKASELGASRFIPVVTDHTVVHRMNIERARSIAIEAAEQSERLDVMQVEEPSSLKDILKSWNKERKLIFCIERGLAPAITQALANIKTPAALLIGPEGGFSEAESAYIKSLEYTVPVSLGPRILRAETALIAGLSCLMAQAGDWS